MNTAENVMDSITIPENESAVSHGTGAAQNATELLQSRAKELSKVKRRTSKHSDIQCLEFELSGMSFAFEIRCIREVMRNTAPVTPLPGLAQFFLGLANVRGEIIPVIDLASYLGIPSPKEELKSLILLQAGDIIVAFPCERIVRTREFSKKELQSAVAAQSQAIAAIAEGCGPKGIIVLDGQAFIEILKNSLAEE